MEADEIAALGPGNALRRAVSRSLNAGRGAMVRLSASMATVGRGMDRMKLMYVDYEARSDDVFLVSYPRSGVTRLQMMLYQLTTDGSMDFIHIADKVPWFERLPHSRKKLSEVSSPRVFKSHLPYGKIPKGPCRYVYMARNGADVAASYYRFHRSYRMYERDFSEFFGKFADGDIPPGSWCDHVAGWWEHRDDPDVLFLWYEDLQSDPASTLRAVADHCGIELEEDRVSRLVRRCSIEFMKEHERQFDPIIEALWENGINEGAFLRRGKTGEGARQLSPEQSGRIEQALVAMTELTVSGLREASGALLRQRSAGGPGDP